MKNKQTAVEWLIVQLKLHETGEAEWMSKSSILSRAIRMEKKQIMNDYLQGIDSILEVRNEEEYYNETYGK